MRYFTRSSSTNLRGNGKGLYWSGRRDLNPGPLAPQASALARLRHGPKLSVYRTRLSTKQFNALVRNE